MASLKCQPLSPPNQKVARERDVYQQTENGENKQKKLPNVQNTFWDFSFNRHYCTTNIVKLN